MITRNKPRSRVESGSGGEAKLQRCEPRKAHFCTRVKPCQDLDLPDMGGAPCS